MKRTLKTKLTLIASIAALAFGAMACEVEGGGGIDGDLDQPMDQPAG